VAKGIPGILTGLPVRAAMPPGAMWWSGEYTLGPMAADQQTSRRPSRRCLEHEGVTCVFGIPGEENIYLTDALSGRRSATSWSATSRRRRSWPRSTAA
jgi:hypothetical protein